MKKLKKVIKQIYHSNKGRYGYRRVTYEFLNRGYKLNRKTVYKLMQELGLQSFVRVRRYRSYKGNYGKVAPNISYNISESPNFHQIEDRLDKAFIRISDNANLILHSDQGWQYQMEKY